MQRLPAFYLYLGLSMTVIFPGKILEESCMWNLTSSGVRLDKHQDFPHNVAQPVSLKCR